MPWSHWLQQLCLGSCGGNTDDGAHTLVDSIHRCIAIGNYEHAYALMDSLNTRYPDSIALRKAIMAEKAQAQANQARSMLPKCIARVDSLTVAIDDASKDFITRQTSSTMGSYLVHRNATNIDLAANRNAIQPRVVDMDTPWLIATTLVSSKAPISLSIKDASGNILAQTAISADACVHSDDAWRFNVGPEAATPLANALQAYHGKGTSAVVTDAAGKSHSISISAALAEAIVASEHLASLQSQLFYARKTCENYNVAYNWLAISRQMMAEQPAPCPNNISKHIHNTPIVLHPSHIICSTLYSVLFF